MVRNRFEAVGRFQNVPGSLAVASYSSLPKRYIKNAWQQVVGGAEVKE